MPCSAGLPADKQDGPAVAAVRAKIKLAEEAAALGNPAEFEARLAKDPKDHQARFDLAVIQNAQGKRAEAADNLLAIVKADRTWRDDAARQQLLQFFDAWGPDRRSDAGEPPQAVVDPVLVMPEALRAMPSRLAVGSRAPHIAC